MNRLNARAIATLGAGKEYGAGLHYPLHKEYQEIMMGNKIAL
ncbi:hypothetical protein [Bartonella harrusi]|nr:hypothetical protein [Bartonella harrusi]